MATFRRFESHLYVALDLSYLSNVAFDELYELLQEIGRMTFVLATP